LEVTLSTVGIRIVADCVSRIFQFTTNVFADYNLHIYYNFGYYFYTLLPVWLSFRKLASVGRRHTLCQVLALAVGF
jgi:hypothetical protein